MRNSRWRTLLALLFAFALVAAACSGDEEADEGEDVVGGVEDTTPIEEAEGEGEVVEGAEGDLAGTSVTITGPERSESEAGALQDALDAFGEASGIEITYTGDADWEANINTQVAGGNPPDISIFPQPGKLADFARDGVLQPVPEDVAAAMQEHWSEDWYTYSTVDGQLYGVPVKSDLKSLVWYLPGAFAEKGYEVPETLDALMALTDEMVANGDTPWCVGIESGQATGWPFTDWTEDVMLRLHGAEVYDQWVTHEIPFDDERVVEAMQLVVDMWEGKTFSSGGSIAATSFQDNAVPLIEGNCMMHRQASFFASFLPEGTPVADGSEGAVDVFYFPGDGENRPVLGAGTFAAAFNDRPEVWAVIEYMASAEYAERRQAAQAEFTGGLSGFLSAAEGQDENVYSALEQSFLEILLSADPFRFDASDLMPADVGAGTFWSEGTSLVNGEIDAATAAANIESSWPS